MAVLSSVRKRTCNNRDEMRESLHCGGTNAAFGRDDDSYKKTTT
jgi:hypothetical protein